MLLQTRIQAYARCDGRAVKRDGCDNKLKFDEARIAHLRQSRRREVRTDQNRGVLVEPVVPAARLLLRVVEKL